MNADVDVRASQGHMHVLTSTVTVVPGATPRLLWLLQVPRVMVAAVVAQSTAELAVETMWLPAARRVPLAAPPRVTQRPAVGLLPSSPRGTCSQLWPGSAAVPRSMLETSRRWAALPPDGALLTSTPSTPLAPNTLLRTLISEPPNSRAP